MASSQESMSIQSQLQGDISDKLKEDLKYDDRHHWDKEMTHKITCPVEVKGGAQIEFYENNSDPDDGRFKAALVYNFAIDNVSQYWMFAWHSPPAEPGSANKVLTKLYYNKDAIKWDLIEQELDNSINKSSYTQGGATVRFTALENGTSDFKAQIAYAPSAIAIPK